MHDALAPLYPHWGFIGGMPVPLHFGDPVVEKARAQTLAVCDVSALERAVWKGPGAAGFLAEQGIDVPADVLGAHALPGSGVIGRTGGTEFFLEDGPHGNVIARLDRAKDRGQAGVYRVLRQDASLLLAGSRAVSVFRQTCGHPIGQKDEGIVFTRVAGVSCMVCVRVLHDLPTFQLWLDGSYGLYLWETLLPIVEELGGAVVGAACFFPELAGDGRVSG